MKVGYRENIQLRRPDKFGPMGEFEEQIVDRSLSIFWFILFSEYVHTHNILNTNEYKNNYVNYKFWLFY